MKGEAVEYFCDRCKDVINFRFQITCSEGNWRICGKCINKLKEWMKGKSNE